MSFRSILRQAAVEHARSERAEAKRQQFAEWGAQHRRREAAERATAIAADLDDAARAACPELFVPAATVETAAPGRSAETLQSRAAAAGSWDAAARAACPELYVRPAGAHSARGIVDGEGRMIVRRPG